MEYMYMYMYMYMYFNEVVVAKQFFSSIPSLWNTIWVIVPNIMYKVFSYR